MVAGVPPSSQTMLCKHDPSYKDTCAVFIWINPLIRQHTPALCSQISLSDGAGAAVNCLSRVVWGVFLKGLHAAALGT